MPEELDDHVSIHRSTSRPNFTEHLVNRAASPEKEDGPGMEKEKKKCNMCEKNLASSSFNRHMKDKHGKSEECEICKKRFLTQSGLESHQRKAHVVNIISYFECHFSDYKSMNKYYMTDHVRRQHAGEGSNSFVCNKCYTRKQNEHLLMKHMQQHQESNCVVCGK